eukprot:CAMPEP_0114038450 /NCGR_PEP_ID=MMETSP1339-20121228/2571_1 /TAXON_ID=94617 /ORGANISM="Fibrocapsa japonica" /LENGTH=44 /assembly_acc=CAM_ASM_000762
MLVSKVKEQKELRDAYGGEFLKERERIQKSATRVGLQLPEEYAG